MGECPDCKFSRESGKGPFATGRELVEFVYQAHDGAIRDQPIAEGGLATTCQGCGTSFVMETYVCRCPECGGFHAIAPVHANSAEHIQYAGPDFNPGT
jgi:hypothetical protein